MPVGAPETGGGGGLSSPLPWLGLLVLLAGTAIGGIWLARVRKG
ncbi:hypothetical protein [Actinokineospora sp. NPDC004072]